MSQSQPTKPPTPETPSETPTHDLPSSLVHDLRTPLNQIIGYSEMLIESAQETHQDDFAADLEKVRSAGHRLLSLINDNFRSVHPTEIAAPTAAALIEAKKPVVVTDIEYSIAEKTIEPTQGFILVVDDIEANRDVLSRRLEKQGYDVATAKNGVRALEKLRTQSFDLVLLDIMMPEMNGYEVLQTIQNDETLRHIPVVMISALGEMDSVVRCVEMGAADYLTKPFNPTLLKARIGASLEKKRAHDRETHLFAQLQENYGRLQELEKLRDNLTHMIIHDLRTPLTSVIMGMQTLEVTGDLNDDQREMLNIAVSGGETLLGMINDLLDVEKLESGTMQLDLAVLSPTELVDSAIVQVATLVESKQLSLLRHVAADLPTLRGDENKLRRTLVNLLGNAIKFTPSGGTITVETRQSEDAQSVVFDVKDTGEGIPPESFERIFEKFGQVESRQAGRMMSTGLGLTFCKLAVEAHGGHIGVESVIGEGSTFCFALPLTEN